MIEIQGKIPLRIHPFFWVVALIIGWLNSFSEGTAINLVLLKTVLWVAVITISVIVHEFGHALSAVAFGQNAKIDLVGFGGLTQRTGGKIKFWQDFLIVLAGPLFGLGLALLAYLTLYVVGEQPVNIGRYILEIFFYVNTFWTIINLLPIQPLDGGRLLAIFLEGILGVRGIKIAYFISVLLSTAVGILFFSMQALIAGSLFLMLAFESYQMWKETLSMRDQDKNDKVKDLFSKAEEDFHLGRKKDALDKFQSIREVTKSGVLYRVSTYYQALLLSEQADYKTAYEMLNPLQKQLDLQGKRLLQGLAYHNGVWKQAIQLGDYLFSETPDYEIAFINAMSYAKLEEAKPAVGWLESAIRQGMPHPRVMLSKDEFDPIRQNLEFQKFFKGL